MKCIKQVTDETKVTRVSDEAAKRAVASGKHVYASKAEWKANGRVRANAEA